MMGGYGMMNGYGILGGFGMFIPLLIIGIVVYAVFIETTFPNDFIHIPPIGIICSYIKLCNLFIYFIEQY